MINTTVVRLFLVCAASCAYHPGSFRDRAGDWPGTRTSSGCIDLAVARRDRQDVTGAVITYNVGNRCDHRVVVDLASIRAIGRDVDGNEVPLVAHDPRGELRPVPLAALWSMSAEIAYQHGDAAVGSMCVDIGHVNRDDPAQDRWSCFATEIP